MFKKLFFSAILAVSVFSVAQAQDDSLYYDLGRVLVRKSNTKTTTIKGVDLEKYQASNLSDAINVWLYGTYSNSASIVYVVDGNILTDVNVYSIYDIEELTLVENATSQASGAGPGRQMVLIKLRTDRNGKRGIEVNGQNSLVDLRNTQPPSLASTAGSNSSSYDNYYVSAYRNYNNVRMGISTEYQRDVDPRNNGYGLEFLQPASFNRFKVNAYLNANLWKGTTLSFGASYLPQNNHYSFTQDTIDAYSASPYHNVHNSQIAQHLYNTDLSIKSNIAKGLTNRLSIAYAHSNYLEKDLFGSSTVYNNATSSVDSTITNAKRSHNLLFRDYLVYTGKLGEFDVQPTVSFTYRNVLDSTHYLNAYLSQYTGFPDQNLDYVSHARTLARRFMMTPAIDINFKEILDVNTGFVTVLNSIKDTSAAAHISHVYPFVSTSLNLSKALGITFIKWQLFASYSKQGAVLGDESTSLYNFTTALNPASVRLVAGDPNLPHNNDSYQAGMGVGLFKNFAVSYNYEYKYYTTYTYLIAFTDGGPVTNVIPVNSRLAITHLSAHYSVRTDKFSWMTTLTGTESHMQAVDTALGNRFNSTYLSQGHRWSGGMTHRFTYGNYFGGVDLLYQTGERPEDLLNALSAGPTVIPVVQNLNNNSFVIQNIFFGVRFKLPHLKFAELYANGHNLAQNQSSDITDNRRMYGLGFKAGI
ncbi:MAG: hypothetical protein JSU01_01710 [Bacteroidetes bacterium]|nr:hypothetical protein [Bacteroidota bacterium]